MPQNRPPEIPSAFGESPICIVVFGGSGDLTRRKLAPALHSLSCAGLLPETVDIVGVGRRAMDDESFRSSLFDGIQSYARLKSAPHLCTRWTDLRSRFHYHQVPHVTLDALRGLLESLPQLTRQPHRAAGYLFYFAVPPEAAPDLVSCLGQALEHAACALRPDWIRVVLEKPVGRDAQTAYQLETLLSQWFTEQQIYRIDHYLGKETVQNLLAFRFANCIFEPLWNAQWIDHVQITVAESLGVEGRAAFYDRIGVVRDIVQNHLLQLLTLVAMEPPERLDANALRDEKVKVLRSIAHVDPSAFVLGQYEDYVSEDQAPPDSTTPTFAALRLELESPRWRGVPFYVRTGKRMAKKTTEITLQFKPISRSLLADESPSPNRLSLHIQPDEGMRLQFAVKIPGAGLSTRVEDMVFRYGDTYPETALPDAYERLLLDALRGDPSLFIRRDEIELAWRIVTPLLESAVPPDRYPQGSWGPASANRLFADRKPQWMSECRRTRGG